MFTKQNSSNHSVRPCNTKVGDMDSRKLQVVLVDDNEDDRAFFRSALAESSLEVDLFEAKGVLCARLAQVARPNSRTTEGHALNR